ncbi:MAG: hypothetical protein KAT93_07895 [Desulfuromonadales bacterium]|nr:hypothetical protein [Desulfuromonadales bacterium]
MLKRFPQKLRVINSGLTVLDIKQDEAIIHVSGELRVPAAFWKRFQHEPALLLLVTEVEPAPRKGASHGREKSRDRKD